MDMNKEFEYKNHTFNIKVELNTKVERRPNGNRWHTVTINCMDNDNYYKKAEVLDEKLVDHIKFGEQLAKKYIDEKLSKVNPIDERLSKLGFK
jgi:hypothetical protein